MKQQPQTMPDKNIICSAYFPKTDTHALVQEENDCVYLYLYIRPDSKDTEIRACWVRNYGKAIDAVDEKALDAGAQPRMPLRACRHPQGAARLDPKDLRLVFLEDGDGAALYEGDQLLSVIPGWASSGEFTGYARDAIGTSPFAWELGKPRQNDIFKRVRQAESYWKSMQDNATWEHFRDQHLQAIERAYGPHAEYLVVDVGYFPPRAVVTVREGDTVWLFTLGMSLLQQPSVDRFTQYPEGLRRAELAMGVREDLFREHRDAFVAYLVGRWPCGVVRHRAVWEASCPCAFARGRGEFLGKALRRFPGRSGELSVDRADHGETAALCRGVGQRSADEMRPGRCPRAGVPGFRRSGEVPFAGKRAQVIEALKRGGQNI